ncbi:MAG: GTPase, partial [Nanoarchaeota archaeon]
MKKDYFHTVIDVIKKSDLVLIVLDARFPDDSRNLAIERKINSLNKKFIYVLNKVDLINETILKEKTKNLQPKVFMSSKFNLGTKVLRREISESTKKRPIYVSVVGYPNTGKSFLINCLKQKRSAGVSPRAGFTKGIQKIKVSEGIYLIDTPGVIPRSVKDDAKRIMTNIKNIEGTKDIDMIAMEIITLFIKKNPSKLEKFYKIRIRKNSEKTLEAISKKLNHLKKHCELDIERTSRKIIL